MKELIKLRLERQVALMEQNGIDLLIATTAENVHYLTGFFSIAKQVIPSMHLFAVLDKSGSVFLVCSKAEIPSAMEEGLRSEQLHCFGPFQFAPPPEGDPHAGVLALNQTDSFTALASVLKKCNATRVVGIDGDGVTHAAYEKLRETVGSGARIVDGGKCIRASRLLKFDAEIRSLRKSGQIVEAAIQEVCEQYVSGQTEKEAQQIFERYVVSQGARPNFTVISSGPRSAFVDTRTTDRPMVEGDLIRFDVGCVFEGMHSDIARTVSIGEPAAKMKTFYTAIRNGMQAMLDACRPGARAGDIFDVGVSTTRRSGIPHYARNHCGHGIGMQVYEAPGIVSTSDEILAERMTMCLETPYYEFQWGGVQVEDSVVVTSEGCEPFTISPVKLIVI
ncbi:Xaa-Pro aminopeptidase [Burkholderia sp. GAS332]|nr:Xaa-Pro aminopeptidase [Burkholderia sp. GAS332]